MILKIKKQRLRQVVAWVSVVFVGCQYTCAMPVGSCVHREIELQEIHACEQDIEDINELKLQNADLRRQLFISQQDLILKTKAFEEQADKNTRVRTHHYHTRVCRV